MTGGTAALTAQEFQHAEGTEDWRALGSMVSAWFSAPSHTAGAELVRRLADQNVAVEPSVRATGVRVDIVPAGRGLSTADVTAARTVSAEVAALGLVGDPAVLQTLRLTFDVRDRAAVPPFWATVLGYLPAGSAAIADPVRRNPSIRFQDRQEQRPRRNRLHLDAVTPQPVARAALETVRGRGAGAIADHGFYATVADVEGNEVDLLPLEDGADGWGEPDTEDWRLVFSAIACYRADSPKSAARLAQAVAELADEAGLPLGIDLRPGLVVLDTGKDLWEQDSGYRVLAARIQHTARALGFTADVTGPRFIQLGIDAADIPAVRRFWCAVLAYQEDPREGVTDIIDPRQLTMPLFFQPIDTTEIERLAQRNRIHLDAFVPGDQAQARVAAGLAAGGSLVSEEHAPFRWTLADPEGNEVDISVSAH